MIGTWFYAGLLVVAALVWPLLFVDTQPALALILAVFNIALFTFVWRSCATANCSYWRGLNIIAASMMSGCANITILYAPLVLVIVYLLSIVIAVQGLCSPQHRAGTSWEKVVLNFYEHRLWR
jgi:hypothetical protein